MAYQLILESESEILYDFILNELNYVKENIRKHTHSKFGDVEHVIMDVIKNDGKQLRPLMVILASHFGRYEKEKINTLASSIEMLHMATLVHDDIIDEAKLRRGVESVQSKYGKDIAVYTGDYLLAKAVGILNHKDYEGEHIEKLVKVIARICESELMQYQNRYKPLSIKNYLKVISGKTAALFAISLYIGASESGCEESVAKTLGRIGYELGMAFQIIDDLLDFDLDQHKIGKNTLSDFNNGYYTIPVLFALKNQSFNLSELTYDLLIDFVKLNKGMEHSRKLAKKYTKRAYQRIEQLEDSAAKEVLNRLAKKMLDREY